MSSKDFPCRHCPDQFSFRTSRNRHERSQHRDRVFHSCPICHKSFKATRNLDEHLKSHDQPPSHVCPMCQKAFRLKHDMEHHRNTRGCKRPAELSSSSAHPAKRTRQPFWVDPEESTPERDPALGKVYEDHQGAIKTNRLLGHHHRTYTIHWPSHQTPPSWDNVLRDIFHDQRSKFKINYSHSLILQNQETDEYRFYHACQNNARVMEHPRLICRPGDVSALNELILEDDILEFARQQRPTSKWTVHGIAATSFYVNPLPDHPIGGCCDKPLPEYIKSNRAINALVKDEHNQVDYKDNLCFFRCLALHRGASTHALQIPTLNLFRSWTQQDSPCPGVTLNDIPRLETYFQTNVEVFEFDTHRPTCTGPILIPRRRSELQHPTTVYVLLYEDHFCYIKDLDSAAHSFGCSKCGKLWKEQRRLRRHENSCTEDKVTHTYPGGVYQLPLTPLQALERHGLSVDTAFTYPYRATYDFETYFTKEDLPQTSKHTAWTAKHIPLSVSVCSNIPGYDVSRCFVTEGDSQALIDRMMEYLMEMADTAYRLLREEFSEVYEELEVMTKNEEQRSVATGLTQTLDQYLKQIPVVGFNSGKYDINVIKPYLFQWFVTHEEEKEEEEKEEKEGEAEKEEEEEEEEEEEQLDTEKKTKRTNPFTFLVKKNNDFMCISTPVFKFVDITNYLAPGFSYAKYLAAFEVEQRKGFFPYEYISGIESLEETELPPPTAFRSSLKNSDISEEDYSFCQRVWKEEGMTTLKDFLVWYNNLDVVPFLDALQKQTEFYVTLGLDMLKDGLGVPGLTMRYLFQTLSPDVCFSLVNEQNKEIHDLLRRQMVGGPSIIFHRYHEKGVTKIRGGKEVRSVIGLDANALYLWALSQDMPTEEPILRRKETQFKAEKTRQFGQKAREWLEYVSETEGVRLIHQHNGKEHRLGSRRIPVDGWDATHQTAYQFHGCYFHGHKCTITEGQTHNKRSGKSFEELSEATRDITHYLRQKAGVTVVEMRECEWDSLKRQNPQIRRFCRDRFPYIPAEFRTTPITADHVLKAVREKRLFGLIQCDIEVPEHLREHFSELQPIFKNAEVSRDDIGPLMRDYAEKHKTMSQPRRMLIGSYFGKGILLATPLLLWYLDHGLRVKDIQLVMEYVPKPCFEAFGDKVSNARRRGDRDPSTAILAETMKLLGNSAYGKTLTNKAKHRDVKYVTEDRDVQRLVNEPLFRKMTPLTDDLVEVEMTKQKICWDLPNQIGFCVYQYAKLRMLEFYYDCVDKYVARDEFQLCEMDTDSLYMGLSTPTFEDAVKPELKKDFYEHYHLWFPSLACDQHRKDFVQSRLSDIPWTPCECCLQRHKFDKRTPGLFKTEYEGDGIVALCSKTYYCFGRKSDKVSCKGLNKKINDLTKEKYLAVLETQTAGGGINRSFRTDGKTMYTYEQSRMALSFFYPKRRVGVDGVTTSPILI